MSKNLIQRINVWIEGLLGYPGCDKKNLNTRKIMWLATVYGFFHVILLTLGFLLYSPEFLRILINYGYILSAILLTGIIVPPKLKVHFKAYFVLHLFLMLSVTFIYILKLGGIATSAGLIMACLAFVLSSIPLQDSRITISLFSYYAIIIVLSGVLSPWLTVPKEMTPSVNAVLTFINALSMSLMIMYLTLGFFAQQRKIEELESNKLKELSEAKNKLFTNITHEFRTPLTVILGMADLIEKNPDEWHVKGTEKIKNNGMILINLVNQMLDLARIEAGVVQPHYIQSDIQSYIGYITDLFRSTAEIRGIKLCFNPSEDSFVMDFDADKVLHILSNLISNALKFTPEGGTTTVSTGTDSSNQIYSICIADTGIGIPPEHLPHIFDRFYQVENSSGNTNGTGLGLALTKELTELLGGRISVESIPGKGSNFIIQLPVSRNASPENYTGIEINKEQITTLSSMTDIRDQEMVEDFSGCTTLPVLLIVEDSTDVSQYLTTLLKNEYQIETAKNGKEGLAKALNRIPDIILSDVMMPEMDGISLLEKLKKDIRTSHIPVVLLTAKVDIASRLTGLESGADAYLAKPFDGKELHIILKNLIEIRKKLHERYSSLENLPLIPEPGYTIEDEFMQKVRRVLEENLDNDEFGILQLCHELAVSHTQLYRKFKSVSNKTISEFLKSLRLNKAKNLLLTTTLNITEVVFAAGFKNLSYFSREFAAEFGSSPHEFRRRANLERTAQK